MNIKRVTLAAATLVLLVTSGCFRRAWARGGRYYASGPIVVRSAPPAARVVIQQQQVAPAPGYVWSQGHWVWSGNNWVWSEGEWVAPRQGYTYMQPTWQSSGSAWQYQPGTWVVGNGGYSQTYTYQQQYPQYQQQYQYPQQQQQVVVVQGQPQGTLYGNGHVQATQPQVIVRESAPSAPPATVTGTARINGAQIGGTAEVHVGDVELRRSEGQPGAVVVR